MLELNASDDRGINVVRTKINDFAAVAVGSNNRPGYALTFFFCFGYCQVSFFLASFSFMFLCVVCISSKTIILYFSGYPCPSFKIIILDEADSMTEDAQVR